MPKTSEPKYLWIFMEVSINNHDWINHYCWLITSSKPAPEGSCVAFPECSHDLAKKSKCQEFQEGLGNEPGQGSNMDQIWILNSVKKRIRKGSGGFTHCLSLDPTSQTTRALCFLCSCSCCSVVPGLSDCSNNKGIILLDTAICFLAQKEIKG